MTPKNQESLAVLKNSELLKQFGGPIGLLFFKIFRRLSDSNTSLYKALKLSFMGDIYTAHVYREDENYAFLLGAIEQLRDPEEEYIDEIPPLLEETDLQILSLEQKNLKKMKIYLETFSISRSGSLPTLSGSTSEDFFSRLIAMLIAKKSNIDLQIKDIPRLPYIARPSQMEQFFSSETVSTYIQGISTLRSHPLKKAPTIEDEQNTENPLNTMIYTSIFSEKNLPIWEQILGINSTDLSGLTSQELAAYSIRNRLKIFDKIVKSLRFDWEIKPLTILGIPLNTGKDIFLDPLQKLKFVFQDFSKNFKEFQNLQQALRKNSLLIDTMRRDLLDFLEGQVQDPDDFLTRYVESARIDPDTKEMARIIAPLNQYKTAYIKNIILQKELIDKRSAFNASKTELHTAFRMLKNAIEQEKIAELERQFSKSSVYSFVDFVLKSDLFPTIEGEEEKKTLSKYFKKWQEIATKNPSVPESPSQEILFLIDDQIERSLKNTDRRLISRAANIPMDRLEKAISVLYSQIPADASPQIIKKFKQLKKIFLSAMAVDGSERYIPQELIASVQAIDSLIEIGATPDGSLEIFDESLNLFFKNIQDFISGKNVADQARELLSIAQNNALIVGDGASSEKINAFSEAIQAIASQSHQELITAPNPQYIAIQEEIQKIKPLIINRLKQYGEVSITGGTHISMGNRVKMNKTWAAADYIPTDTPGSDEGWNLFGPSIQGITLRFVDFLPKNLSYKEIISKFRTFFAKIPPEEQQEILKQKNRDTENSYDYRISDHTWGKLCFYVQFLEEKLKYTPKNIYLPKKSTDPLQRDIFQEQTFWNYLSSEFQDAKQRVDLMVDSYDDFMLLFLISYLLPDKESTFSDRLMEQKIKNLPDLPDLPRYSREVAKFFEANQGSIEEIKEKILQIQQRPESYQGALTQVIQSINPATWEFNPFKNKKKGIIAVVSAIASLYIPSYLPVSSAVTFAVSSFFMSKIANTMETNFSQMRSLPRDLYRLALGEKETSSLSFLFDFFPQAFENDVKNIFAAPRNQSEQLSQFSRIFAAQEVMGLLNTAPYNLNFLKNRVHYALSSAYPILSGDALNFLVMMLRGTFFVLDPEILARPYHVDFIPAAREFLQKYQDTLQKKMQEISTSSDSHLQMLEAKKSDLLLEFSAQSHVGQLLEKKATFKIPGEALISPSEIKIDQQIAFLSAFLDFLRSEKIQSMGLTLSESLKKFGGDRDRDQIFSPQKEPFEKSVEMLKNSFNLVAQTLATVKNLNTKKYPYLDATGENPASLVTSQLFLENVSLIRKVLIYAMHVTHDEQIVQGVRGLFTLKKVVEDIVRGNLQATFSIADQLEAIQKAIHRIEIFLPDYLSLAYPIVFEMEMNPKNTIANTIAQYVSQTHATFTFSKRNYLFNTSQDRFFSDPQLRTVPITPWAVELLKNIVGSNQNRFLLDLTRHDTDLVYAQRVSPAAAEYLQNRQETSLTIPGTANARRDEIDPLGYGVTPQSRQQLYGPMPPIGSSAQNPGAIQQAPNRMGGSPQMQGAPGQIIQPIFHQPQPASIQQPTQSQEGGGMMMAPRPSQNVMGNPVPGQPIRSGPDDEEEPGFADYAQGALRNLQNLAFGMQYGNPLQQRMPQAGSSQVVPQAAREQVGRVGGSMQQQALEMQQADAPENEERPNPFQRGRDRDRPQQDRYIPPAIRGGRRLVRRPDDPEPSSGSGLNMKSLALGAGAGAGLLYLASNLGSSSNKKPSKKKRW